MLYQLFAIVSCGFIAYQDLKDRLVYWFLFPILGLFIGLAHYTSTNPNFFWIASLTNILLVTIMLLVTWSVTVLILKKPFLNHSMGLGDVLYIIAFAFGFPTFTFLVLLVGAMVFSLLVHFITHRYYKNGTIPLAGYMSMYLILILLFSKLEPKISLYTL